MGGHVQCSERHQSYTKCRHNTVDCIQTDQRELACNRERESACILMFLYKLTRSSQQLRPSIEERRDHPFP